MDVRRNPVGALLSYIAIALIVTFVGLIIGSFLPPSLVAMVSNLFFIVILIGFFIAIFAKRPRSGYRRKPMSMTFVNIYAFIMGITLYPAISYYVYDLGGEIVLAVILGTLVVVGILGFMSFRKGNDNILRLGPILFASTMGLLIMSLLMIFFTSLTRFDLMISIISTVIFSLWVVYDVYRFKRNMSYIQTTSDLAPYVLDIYVDIINLMLDALRIVSRLKD